MPGASPNVKTVMHFDLFQSIKEEEEPYNATFQTGDEEERDSRNLSLHTLEPLNSLRR